MNLTKAELVASIASDSDISKSAAEKALDSVVTNITTALKKGKSITLVGFGSFTAKKRAAREGRNPKTGEKIKISAAMVPKFKASSKLKTSLN